MKCILVSIKQNKKVLIALTIVKFYNERMLNIHQDISLFFSSQAIANCGWKNEQQTQVFKPLQKGQQIKITDIMHNRKSDCSEKDFQRNNAYWHLTSSVIQFSQLDSVRESKTEGYRNANRISNIKDVHFISLSRKLVPGIRTTLRGTSFHVQKNTLS